MRHRSRQKAFGAFLSIALAAVVILAGASAVHAVDATPSEAEAAVRAASRLYVEALGRGDADAIAGIWTEDGVYVDAASESFVARQLAQLEFGDQATDAKQPPREAAAVKSTIRFVHDDVALEEGISKSSEPGDSDANGVRFSAVWVREKNGWQLDHLREYSAQPTVESSPMEDLGWFIGEWTAQGEGLDATLSAHWSDDGKFLMQRFTIRRDGQEDMGAEQRIAWDPAAEVIRSWSFHSDGGFVEGEWRREGDAWIVATAGVLPSGDRTTSNIIWVSDGPNSCWFKLDRGTVADTDAEELIVEFKRNDNSR